MKSVRIVLVTMVVVMMFCGICYAEEQWEYIYETDKSIEYIDINSIKILQVGSNEIIKAITKTQSKDSDFYVISYFKVKKDTKGYDLYFIEMYEDGKLTNQLTLDATGYKTYEPDNKIVNEILKRAN